LSALNITHVESRPRHVGFTSACLKPPLFRPAVTLAGLSDVSRVPSLAAESAAWYCLPEASLRRPLAACSQLLTPLVQRLRNVPH